MQYKKLKEVPYTPKKTGKCKECGSLVVLSVMRSKKNKMYWSCPSCNIVHGPARKSHVRAFRKACTERSIRTLDAKLTFEEIKEYIWEKPKKKKQRKTKKVKNPLLHSTDMYCPKCSHLSKTKMIPVKASARCGPGRCDEVCICADNDYKCMKCHYRVSHEEWKQHVLRRRERKYVYIPKKCRVE